MGDIHFWICVVTDNDILGFQRKISIHFAFGAPIILAPFIYAMRLRVISKGI